jgi:hypothetical protein
MNTSRDIEKLFDQFGGNAADYQEIGRETEANTARTRWPLLATLDFSQPSIPDIAQHDPLAPGKSFLQANQPPGQPAKQPNATPITRAKLPLFARAHRRTIPPVANVTLPAASVGAARFSALAESVEMVSQTPEPVAGLPRAQVAPTAAGLPRVPDAEPVPAFLASRPPAAKVSLPRVSPSVTPAAAPEPAAPSILGKLFQAQPQSSVPPAPDAHASSLQSVFERLRAPAAPADTPKDTFSWVASRASRS